MTLKKYIAPFLILFAFFASVEISIAEETKTIAEETKTIAADTTKTLDPSRPKTKFFSRYEFKEDEDGNEVSLIEILYDFPINNDWSVRIQAPVLYRNPVSTEESETGMGDMTVRIANNTFTTDGGTPWFLALDTKWDTASDATLGNGKNRVAPTIFGFVKVPSLGLLAFPQFQTFFTIGGDDSRTDVKFTSLKLPILKKLPDRYYVSVEPFVAWDHTSAERSTGTLVLEYGRFVNSSTMLYFRPGTTLWGDNSAFSYEYSIEVGFRLFL
ncbi:MAG: hypothetical protein O3B03_00510 [Proteobacteria bacterium]|nr:hypothetical protein [Pseudomonadota bacterium]MDA1330990.1 hypothetical protein [Pseudomonadota bacterium]